MVIILLSSMILTLENLLAYQNVMDQNISIIFRRKAFKYVFLTAKI